jgi:glycosyltransferase involved in cell wall biosynthesis
LKITWASNAPWAATGYGTQTRQMLKRLLADGHDVAVATNHGLSGKPMHDPETGALIFPVGADAYGNDVLLPSRNAHEQGDPGWIITLYDVWVYKSPAFDTERIASWVPIDHYPTPPQVAEWCRKHPAIAMSKFGQAALAKEGIVAQYAPHALELDVWKPTPLMPDGRTARESLNVPEDAFLVMVNAANKGNVPPRKAWGEMLSALSLFMREHPDAYVYLHTELRGVYGGVDLQVLMQSLGIEPERVRLPDQYLNLIGLIPQEVLAAYYTAADVLLATSMGEGFGIPVIEAQACGTPVIVTDFSAQPELVGAGWTVPYQPWWDFTQGAWLALPMVPAIVARLKDAREAKGQLTEQALAKAREYEADAVYAEHWRPILADLESKLHPPTRQQRRAKRRAA